MKILFTSINDHVPWGGSEELWYRAATQLSKFCEVSVLVKKWEDVPWQIQKLEEYSITLFYKKEQSSKKTSWAKQVFQKPTPKAKHVWYESVRNIKEFDLTVISIGNNVEPELPSFTNYLNQEGLRYILIVQLVTDLRMVNDDLIKELKKSYEHAHKVFFLSKENAAKQEMILACKLSNKAFCNNPFKFDQKYLPYFKNDEEFYSIGCVASLTSFHKSQDLLITILGKEKWKNRNLFLNLYGEGINKKQLQSLIDLHGLEEKIKIYGYVENKEKIWSDNLACIMPSRMEGQSLAMLEAMSYGRMIISTKVGDAERLVDHQRTGFLIPAATIEQIDIILEDAWRRRKDWLKMGEMSRSRLFHLINKDPVLEFSEKLKRLIF